MGWRTERGRKSEVGGKTVVGDPQITQIDADWVKEGRGRTEDGGLKTEGRKKKLRSQRSEVGMEKSWWLISR